MVGIETKLLILDDAGLIDAAETISPGLAPLVVLPITSSATSAGVPPVVTVPEKIALPYGSIENISENPPLIFDDTVKLP